MRAAGGLLLLQGHSVGTGEVIYNGTGTQESRFNANQNVVWLAVGPEWSTPVRKGRIDYYLMVGQATVNATSSGSYFNVTGPDPGTTHAPLVLGEPCGRYREAGPSSRLSSSRAEAPRSGTTHPSWVMARAIMWCRDALPRSPASPSDWPFISDAGLTGCERSTPSGAEVETSATAPEERNSD